MSRIDYPTYNFAEKDMSELYPVQLQLGDIPADWIQYAYALSEVSIQYNRADQTTKLPLPLHLAEKLGEYLFSNQNKRSI